MAAFGVDFGTTNSSLARADGPESARIAKFARGGGNTTQTFRSVVYFERDEERQGALRELAGPRGIARYLAAEEPGRFVQSLKSFLAARDFSATRILDREYRLESLIAVLLRALFREAEADVGKLEGTVVVGRPVRFVSARAPEDEELALARLRAAFATAGAREHRLRVRAGRGRLPLRARARPRRADPDRRLRRRHQRLLADPGRPPGARRERESGGARPVLGNAGVPIAGDVFDGRIVRALVAPALGFGSEYRSLFGRVLPVPRWIYAHLERWHHLSFLRSAAHARAPLRPAARGARAGAVRGADPRRAARTSASRYTARWSARSSR